MDQGGSTCSRMYTLEVKVAHDGLILTEAQLIALDRKKEKREALGEIETEHPGYLGAQDTYYVVNIKGVGRIYQQTFIGTYSRIAFARVYDRKRPLQQLIFLIIVFSHFLKNNKCRCCVF